MVGPERAEAENEMSATSVYFRRGTVMHFISHCNVKCSVIFF